MRFLLPTVALVLFAGSFACAQDAGTDSEGPAPVLSAGEGDRTAMLELGGETVIVSYRIVGERAVAGGDMDLGSVEDVNAESLGNLVDMLRSTGRKGLPPEVSSWLDQLEALQIQGKAAKRPGTKRWPGRTIAYRIDASITDAGLKSQIATAVQKWNGQSPAVTFKAATIEPQVLTLTDAPGDGFDCRAQVGYKPGVGGTVFLNPPCLEGNIRHEFLHAVGFMHEHQRSDRGMYIATAPGNDSGANFGTISTSALSEYDPCSMSHYPETVAVGSTPVTWFTLTAAGTEKFARCRSDLPANCRRVGQRCALSREDMTAIGKMYQ